MKNFLTEDQIFNSQFLSYMIFVVISICALNILYSFLGCKDEIKD